MKIAVIIPTYNEAGGIGAVLDELAGVCKTMPEHQWIVLVVDGNSKDTTCKIVEEKSTHYGFVHLLQEKEKNGIAQAYITGIHHAIETFSPDAFVEFDGDGQHDPKYLVPMARALSDGADYIIGSRYIPGGSVPAAWALYRKLISRFGSLYARLLLELPVHDVTSGFKMTRVKNFASKLPLSKDALLSSEYAYKIQFLTVMKELGARIQEVPIAFRERDNDVSKSTVSDLFESLRVTALLRLKHIRNWRLLRVLTIGGIGFIIQTSIFELLGIQHSLVSASIAAVIGGECAILSNFFLNERFAFRDHVRTITTLPLVRLVRFHIVSSGSVFVQWALLFIAEHFTSHSGMLRGTFFAGVVLGFCINYAGYYFYVWRTHKS